MIKLNEYQIARFIQIMEEKNLIEEVTYLGDGTFDVKTSKRLYRVSLSKEWADFVINGIQLERVAILEETIKESPEDNLQRFLYEDNPLKELEKTKKTRRIILIVEILYLLIVVTLLGMIYILAIRESVLVLGYCIASFGLGVLLVDVIVLLIKR